jgi:type I restriction enzyme S subunit
MPLNIGDNVIVEDDIARITEADAKRLQRYRLAEGDIVYSRRGDVEKRALVRSEHDGWLCGTGCLRVRLGDRDRNDSQFISYLLGVPKTREWISQHAIGATMPNLNTGILSSVPLQVPDIEEQRSIVEVLGAFDEKIAANRRLLPLLDLHMALEYTRATSRSGRTVMLADVAAFQNRRRVPLSSRERDERPGDVPYYGASGVFGSVDDSIFDEPLVLVGEDGSVVKEDGTPVIQYIWGPSWVNNHAHVLTGAGISTELLYQAIGREQVTTLVTGAVQPKINMGNLKRMELHIPAPDALEAIEAVVHAETASKRSLVDETRALVATRDALLPLLMSCKLRVKDAEKVLEGVL